MFLKNNAIILDLFQHHTSISWITGLLLKMNPVSSLLTFPSLFPNRYAKTDQYCIKVAMEWKIYQTYLKEETCSNTHILLSVLLTVCACSI